MAKTSSWSTPQAVGVGPNATAPPNDSSGDQAFPSQARCHNARASSSQKRSIRLGPHETAVNPSTGAYVPGEVQGARVGSMRSSVGGNVAQTQAPPPLLDVRDDRAKEK